MHFHSVLIWAGAESTPIFGSLRNRPTHWLTRKLNAERFRNLPLDGPSNTGGGAPSTSDAGGRGQNIRNLFAQAGHQGEDRTGWSPSSEILAVMLSKFLICHVSMADALILEVHFCCPLTLLVPDITCCCNLLCLVYSCEKVKQG